MTVLPDSRAANLAIHVVLWAALIGWQLFTTRSEGVPSIGSVVDMLKSWRVSRWLLLAGWAWLGWHLFVRTTW